MVTNNMSDIPTLSLLIFRTVKLCDYGNSKPISSNSALTVKLVTVLLEYLLSCNLKSLNECIHVLLKVLVCILKAGKQNNL